MDHPKRYIQAVVIVILLAVIGGCQQTSNPSQQPQIPSGTISINADCVAKYYRQDKAPYITEQNHRFIPNAGYLRITSAEPTGTYAFTLNKNQFSETKEKTMFLSALPASFINQQLSTGLYFAFCAGADLLNTDKMSALPPIKIEGQWYQPLPTGQKNNIQATLLKNMNTSRIDLVEVTRHQEGFTPEIDVLYFYRPMQQRWLLRSYNYRYSKELETLVPMKIDVFNTADGLASKDLIIQFEYKGVRTQEKRIIR